MNTKDEILKFEILTFDTSNQSHIKTPQKLLYLLASNDLLWDGEPSINSENCQIKDNCIEISINSIKFDTDSKTEDNISFSIIVRGKYDFLESKRIPILKFLKEQKLETQYVVKDEVSEWIAVQIYPYLYRVENSLRAYITKFMTTKIGVNWWKTEAPQDFNKKVNDRKNNEKEFATCIDNKLYLIDFDDLGEYIHKLSSGCITKENLIEKINALEENPEAVRKLKEEVKSNYDKFFKESFKDKDFQKKWEDLYRIRNKVAHNNLFTDNDLLIVQKIYEELIETIEIASQKLKELTLSAEEVQSIQEEADNLEKIINHNPEHSSRYSERQSHRVTESLIDSLNKPLTLQSIPNILKQLEKLKEMNYPLELPAMKALGKIKEINQPRELLTMKAIQKIAEQDRIEKSEVMKNVGKILEQDRIEKLEAMKNVGKMLEQDRIEKLEVMKNFGQIAEQDKIRRDTLFSTTQPTVDIIQYLKKNGMF